MPRDVREMYRQMAEQTCVILRDGGYCLTDEVVLIGDDLAAAMQGTRLVGSMDVLSAPRRNRYLTRIDVVNQTTLQAAKRGVAAGYRVAALNFASACNPGGGFLNGAQAQEESLARSSGLYACLVGSLPVEQGPPPRTPLWERFYGFHRLAHDPVYTSQVIHSPDVPVFRSEDGVLLRNPWKCSFLTCAAVNAAAARKRGCTQRHIRKLMRDRIDRVLSVAAAEKYDALVLGAWGCGVFGNDPADVADYFACALEGPFCGVFATVIFAVPDYGDGNHAVFAQRLKEAEVHRV